MIDVRTMSLQSILHVFGRIPIPLLPCLPSDARGLRFDNRRVLRCGRSNRFCCEGSECCVMRPGRIHGLPSKRVLQDIESKTNTLNLGEERALLDKTLFRGRDLIRGGCGPFSHPAAFHEVSPECTRGIEGYSRLRPIRPESHLQGKRRHQSGCRRRLWECRGRG